MGGDVVAALPKYLVIGHGRHGKDSAAELLSRLIGQPFASSSEFCAEKAVFPLVRDLYASAAECYQDRGNHRALWYHAIAAYNLRPGPTLAEQLLQDHGIYTGMRRRAEFENTRHLFRAVIWVDASKRLPPEPAESMELTAEDADYILDNNGAADDLPREVCRLFERLKGPVT